MDMRERILAEARRLALESGSIPSLNVLAAAAGVSKGGLTHHFPTRAALLEGLAAQAIEEVDAAMTLAAARGAAAETWLRIAIPADGDLELFRAMALAHHAAEPSARSVIDAADAAMRRWERLIVEEVGDPVRARIIRLVGDGLMANAVAGLDTDEGTVSLEQMIAALGSGPADRA